MVCRAYDVEDEPVVQASQATEVVPAHRPHRTVDVSTLRKSIAVQSQGVCVVVLRVGRWHKAVSIRSAYMPRPPHYSALSHLVQLTVALHSSCLEA